MINSNKNLKGLNYCQLVYLWPLFVLLLVALLKIIDIEISENITPIVTAWSTTSFLWKLVPHIIIDRILFLLSFLIVLSSLGIWLSGWCAHHRCRFLHYNPIWNLRLWGTFLLIRWLRMEELISRWLRSNEFLLYLNQLLNTLLSQGAESKLFLG